MAEQLYASEYERLKNMDVRSIDPATVVDIKDIHIDDSLPPDERVLDAVRQMNGNPFFYRCGDILVKTSFVGAASLQSIWEDCLEHSK